MPQTHGGLFNEERERDRDIEREAKGREYSLFFVVVGDE